MCGWIDFGVNLLDSTAGVDQVADACRVSRVRSVGRSVRHAHAAVFVTQQVIREVEFIPECQIFCG